MRDRDRDRNRDRRDEQDAADDAKRGRNLPEKEGGQLVQEQRQEKILEVNEQSTTDRSRTDDDR